jgi:hypothetical protein
LLPDYEVTNPDWSKTDAEIASAWAAGCPSEVRVAAAPKDWSFTIAMPAREGGCAK